ncbi:DDE_Tnp_1_7 domain-containing protein [Trichonephila clavata]|uniref:DDE_Tnp_1_7 domain-containing protein n=1 Tax=Trichonephila clavata TaxID=2740835 RepID=A0A8X6I2Y8_TRICU|nr:DDE_Tnp_1_7 domain-containing protein [Trichonephila clavata]GFQ86537.1 DDE_Tnp_1_7 domain-containing protein [Trichonephila clavata]
MKDMDLPSASGVLSENESEVSDDDGTIQNVRPWMKININNPPHSPPRFQFSGDPKVLTNISEEDGRLEFFCLFMDRLTRIDSKRNTNISASQHPSSNLGKRKTWNPTNVDEMKLFLPFYFSKF